MIYITEDGFVVPTLTDIYKRKLAEFKTVKPDIRVTDSNIIISLLKFDAAEEYDTDLQGLAQYNNRSIYTATGQDLGIITSYLNMRWRAATKATAKIEIEAEAGTEIPAGWGVETEDGKKYVTLNTVTEIVDQSKKKELEVIALEAGKIGNTEENTITIMTQVLIGITKISNPGAAVGGKDAENDSELRQRFLERVDRINSFSCDGIRNYVVNNSTVDRCQVLENETDEYDAGGRPPHSYEIIVTGETDENMFQVIQDYKLAGIRTWGDIRRKIGNITYGFSRATVKDLYVKIDITASKEYWRAQNIDKIKKALISYVDNVDVASIVYIWKLIGETYQNSEGIINLGVQLGDSMETLKTMDYELVDKNIPRLLEENITVNVIVEE